MTKLITYILLLCYMSFYVILIHNIASDKSISKNTTISKSIHNPIIESAEDNNEQATQSLESQDQNCLRSFVEIDQNNLNYTAFRQLYPRYSDKKIASAGVKIIIPPPEV